MSHRPSVLTLHQSSHLPVQNCNNFYTREKNAYTEHDILIYNILVYNIPKQIAEDDVRHYFSNFGKVVDVTLIQSNQIYQHEAHKVAFVNFAESENACSVLRNKEHCLQGLPLSVMAADSWNQPNADKTCDPTKNEYEIAFTLRGLSIDATATNGDMPMLSLNDDCIETIFGYLTLKEQVRFARVCTRFEDIFQMICNRKFKNFELSTLSELTLWEIQVFFRIAGRNMTSITGTVPYKNHERIVEFIRTSCGKLKRIRLDNTKMRNECLMKLLLSYPQLQVLALRNCSLNDISIQAMSHLNRLETLDLTWNRELTGKFISKFVQLKVLNLYGCYSIQTSHLMDICKSLPNLRSLNIQLCLQLEATPFDAMVEHCKKLEILKMRCPVLPYERVALLPRLKQLVLLCCSLDGTAVKRLLAELVAHKADQLEGLRISSKYTLSAEHIALISELRQLKTVFVEINPFVDNDSLINLCKLQQLEVLTIEGCRNITNKALLKLVKSCQHLRCLNMQYCIQITIEFLLETIRFLKTSEKRKNSLVLMVCGTAIDDYATSKNKEFKKAKEQSLINVVFHGSWLKLMEKDADSYDVWDGERWCNEDNYLTKRRDKEIYIP